VSLTKAVLAEHLCAELGFSKRDAMDIVENFFASIAQSLLDGHEVKISKFGNFSVHEKNARPGRNPKTGEVSLVSERKVIRFKQGGKLKELVNSAEEIV